MSRHINLDRESLGWFPLGLCETFRYPDSNVIRIESVEIVMNKFLTANEILGKDVQQSNVLFERLFIIYAFTPRNLVGPQKYETST